MSTHDRRYTVMIKGMAEGQTAKKGPKSEADTRLKCKLADDLREYMGSTAIDDSVHLPGWRSSLNVDREKMACRADRRRL